MKRQLSEGAPALSSLLSLHTNLCSSTASNDPSPTPLKKPKATSLVLRLDQAAGTRTGSSGEDSATPSASTGAAALVAGQKKKIVLKEPTAVAEKPHKTRGALSFLLLPLPRLGR